MPTVGSPLGNGVNYAAESATILSLKAAGFDLDGFDDLTLEVLSDCPALGVGHVDAVDHIDVLGISRPIDLKAVAFVVSTTLQRLHAGAGRKRDHRLERTPFWYVVDDLFVNIHGNFSFRDINQGGGLCHFDNLGHGADLQCNIDTRQSPNVQMDCRLPECGKT